MKKFYKIENGKAQVGQGTFVPDGFIVYENEPQELVDAWYLDELEQESLKKIIEEVEHRKSLMLEGMNYNGYKISFTKDDGDGVVQVRSAFEMGLTNTVIKFDCGTKMPISSSEFNDFGIWFVTERNKFFKVD